MMDKTINIILLILILSAQVFIMQGMFRLPKSEVSFPVALVAIPVITLMYPQAIAKYLLANILWAIGACLIAMGGMGSIAGAILMVGAAVIERMIANRE